MPPELTSEEQDKVEAGRKETKPSVYDPSGTVPTTISNDFEAWLILADKGVKQRAAKQINAILKAEADKDYQDLFKEASEKEEEAIEDQISDLSGATSTFTEWRGDAGVSGWEDVSEIAWLMQELQQGQSAAGEKEELEYLQNLRKASGVRLLTSTSSTGDRKTRLNAWLAAFNTY